MICLEKYLTPSGFFDVHSFKIQGATPLADISHPLGVVLKAYPYCEIQKLHYIQTL